MWRLIKKLVIAIFTSLVLSINTYSQTGEYIYGCENCTLSQFFPFGEYKIVTYLEPNNANESKIILLDKQNLGLDTLSGWLEGYHGIIKTSESSFTSYGISTVDFEIVNKKIIPRKSLGVRNFPKIKMDDLTIHHPFIFWKDLAVAPFIKINNPNKKKNSTPFLKIGLGYFFLYSDSLIANPDQTALLSSFYGGRIPKEKNFIFNGNEKVNTNLLQILSPHTSFETTEYQDSKFVIHRNHLMVFSPMESSILIVQNDEKVIVKRITVSFDGSKFSLIDLLGDIINQKTYLIALNRMEGTYEIWEWDMESGLYKVLGKTSYLPYHFEDQYYFSKTTNGKRIDILRFPIF